MTVIFTVTRLTEDGDTIPFDRAFRTQEDAVAAAFEDAEADGLDAVLGDEPNHGAVSVTSVPDEDGNYTEEWLIARVTLV